MFGSDLLILSRVERFRIQSDLFEILNKNLWFLKLFWIIIKLKNIQLFYGTFKDTYVNWSKYEWFIVFFSLYLKYFNQADIKTNNVRACNNFSLRTDDDLSFTWNFRDFNEPLDSMTRFESIFPPAYRVHCLTINFTRFLEPRCFNRCWWLMVFHRSSIFRAMNRGMHKFNAYYDRLLKLNIEIKLIRIIWIILDIILLSKDFF